MLHNLPILLTDRLIKLSHVDFDDNQTEVYVYGLECLLNTTITVNILIIWGLISLTLTKTIIWLFAFTLLRHYADGYHAPTNFTCIFSSVLLGASTYFIPSILGNYIVSFIMYFIMILLCFFFAPANNHSDKLIAKSKRYYKLFSMTILFLGFLIQFFLPSDFVVAYTYAFMCCVILMLIKR